MIPEGTPIFTRWQAVDKGLAKYWNGKPCRRGHFDMRYTSDGMCTRCHGAHSKEARKLRNRALGHRSQGLTEPRHTLLRPNECALFDAFVAAIEIARVPHVSATPPGPYATIGITPVELRPGALKPGYPSSALAPAAPSADWTPFDLPDNATLPPPPTPR